LPQGDRILDKQAMDQFLKSVERRAFVMARYAVGNEADALDIVQDSMLKLVQKYGNKPEQEWRPLFYRILNTRITDFHRRRGVRERFQGWIENLLPAGDNSGVDPMAYAVSDSQYEPDSALSAERHLNKLAAALGTLPPRQRQAFMLRCWDGLDTKSTAKAMLCSTGSVKTHYSRALSALREALEEPNK